MPYILTPAPSVDMSNVNFTAWKTKMMEEVAKWKADPNHVIISPFAIMLNKVGEGDEIVVKESVLPVESGCGLRIISGGTPETTLVLTASGHPIGPIEKLEFVDPIEAQAEYPLRVRLTMPVGYLDLRAQSVDACGKCGAPLGETAYTKAHRMTEKAAVPDRSPFFCSQACAES